MAEVKNVKKEVPVKRPPIETARWCYRDKEDDVHHDFAWTITNFSRKINVEPNREYIESDKFSVSAHGMDLEWQVCNHEFERWCSETHPIFSCASILVGKNVRTRSMFQYCLSWFPGDLSYFPTSSPLIRFSQITDCDLLWENRI